ncbi:hypothetical protein AB0M47_10600 [Hamadaea sp. NPDC051192]|uniref:hypothetical protein n=1 Tax=Hamadaea sp. NPDC051192 TaxID=3154940 RepID=UPI00341A9E67
MEPQALHDTARRYLTDRYAELCADDSRPFPRYRVVNAILAEIERLDADDLPPAPELSVLLGRAAFEADSLYTRPSDEGQARAMADERGLFATRVREWAAQPDLQAEPVGYRRVLTKDESTEWRERVEVRWGVANLVWYPMLFVDVPPDVLIVQGSTMWEEPKAELIRQALRELGTQRVIELREGGQDLAIELSLMAPCYYGGEEAVWVDESLAWIAYASHEDTVAFGGTLADRLRLPSNELLLDDSGDRRYWNGRRADVVADHEHPA